MDGQVKQLLSTRRASAVDFGTRLRALMFERRVSIQALYEATGVSVRLIGKYRAGDNEPRNYYGDPTENGRLIADALEVPVDVLLPPVVFHDPNGEPKAA